MTQRFVPGTIDYNGSMAANYPAGRALSAKAATAWRDAIEAFVPRLPGLTILDLGAGTGRFSTFLAETFGARVIGVEPAKGMRTLAAQIIRDNVSFVAGAAESIPLRAGSCDAAWLSQVLHHIRDHACCASELRRVLRDGGRVILRGTYADGQDGFPTLLSYFPGVARVFPDLPKIDETIATFGAHGFTLETRRRVEQETCSSMREFADRTRKRADTSLALLSDDEFSAGMAALDHAAAHELAPEPVREQLDLLVFQAQS